MMYREFVELTGYEPTEEEYRYIEESYYDADDCLNKQEFCARWKKDKKSGAWDRELKLRKQMAEVIAEDKAVIDEKEENLEFYRVELPKAWSQVKELKQTIDKMNDQIQTMETEKAELTEVLKALEVLKKYMG